MRVAQRVAHGRWLLAYSSIAQAGYLLIDVAAAGRDEPTGVFPAPRVVLAIHASVLAP